MPALFIDTSTSDLVLGVLFEGKPLDREEFSGETRQQSSLLFQKLEDFLKSRDLTTDDIDAILFGKGPGSYTGLRVGLSLVKTWCYAKKIPCFVFSSEERRSLIISSRSQLQELQDLAQFEPIYEHDRYGRSVS